MIKEIPPQAPSAARILIDRLAGTHSLTRDEWCTIIRTYTEEDRQYAASLARDAARRQFGSDIYYRGIVEFTNYCRNDCLYCGIRRSNDQARRYRLTEDEILSCCEAGYQMGFRTFVLQGGEDGYFTDDRMTAIVAHIRRQYPACAITLSLGERSEESYRRLYEAGADRYLLRHETADPVHYSRLHPPELSLAHRMQCLHTLRDIGYQVGCGMMIGSPWQTPENLAEDMLFLNDFHPHMIGMGPFIPHHATPFCDRPAGSVELTLLMMSLTRLMLPGVLLPATTALDALREDGRNQGILAGCNVIMPNLSPAEDRKDYLLYDNKPTTRDAAESVDLFRRQVESIGYRLVINRGDAPTTQQR